MTISESISNHFNSSTILMFSRSQILNFKENVYDLVLMSYCEKKKLTIYLTEECYDFYSKISIDYLFQAKNV